jgi:hypothetical protein
MTDTRFRLYTESQKKFAPFERIMPGLRKLMVGFPFLCDTAIPYRSIYQLV